MNKKKNGFTLVELIISFVLVMVVVMYLLKTTVTLTNKNNSLMTLQKFSVYQSNLLENVYKDIDQITNETELLGLEETSNKIKFLDIKDDLGDAKELTFNESDSQIVYDNKIYQLPDGISFRKVNGKVYNVKEENELNKYYVITIYLLQNENNIEKDMKIVYQAQNVEEANSVVGPSQSVILTFDSNADDAIPKITNKIVKTNKPIGTLPIALRDLYDLDGWYTDRQSGSKISENTKVTGDTTYYAHWNSRLKTLAYDFDDLNNMKSWGYVYKERFNINYDASSKMNTISVAGNSGWEIVYMPITTVANKTYKIEFKYVNPNGYTPLPNYSGIGVQALTSVAGNDNSANSIKTQYLSTASNASVEYITFEFTATGTTTYLAFNFGMAIDGVTTTVKLGNIKILEKIEKGTAITNIPSLSPVGYTFNGWYTQENGGTKLTSSATMPSQNITYYGQSQPNTYSLSYSLDGGTYGDLHPSSITYDDLFGVSYPTKLVTAKFQNTVDATVSNMSNITASYAFTGWGITNMDSTLHHYGSEVTTATSISSTAAVLYKNLRSTSGTVTYSAKWSAPTITLPIVTKTGYTCSWASSGINNIASGGTYTPSSSGGATERTFTASCTPNKYYIAYNANGGSGSMDKTLCTYDANCTLSKNAFGWTGHDFSSWNREPGGTSTSYSNSATVTNLATSGTVYLYAQWGLQNRTITYNLVFDTDKPVKWTCDGNTHGLGNHLWTSTGCYSNGLTSEDGIWYSDPATNLQSCTGASQNKTCIYTLEYDSGPKTFPKPITFGSYANLRTSAGWKWGGWYTGKNCTGTRVYAHTVDTTSNQTLYACYKTSDSSDAQTVNYTITYAGGGADSGSVPQSSCASGAACTVKNNNFAKAHYTFYRWKNNETGKTYSPGDTIKLRKNITLTAQWKSAVYTITLNKQGGSGGSDYIYEKYKVGYFKNDTATIAITSITIPERSGYVFKGYYTSTGGYGTQIIDANGEIKSGNDYYSANGSTIYAYWKASSCGYDSTHCSTYNGTCTETHTDMNCNECRNSYGGSCTVNSGYMTSGICTYSVSCVKPKYCCWEE